MRKIRVLFPFVEAGFGHIMTERSIADAFEKKYGDYCEIIRSNFYRESGSEPMGRFEDSLCNEVRKYNKNIAYGYANTLLLKLCGPRLASWFVMRALVPGAYKDSMKYMEELAPDAVISTHWATNYYAEHMENKPYTVMHVPDAHINELFSYPCDFSTISMKEGYESALKNKRRFNPDNLALVPIAIRNEAFDITESASELRQRYGYPDRFTIYITEGGYGIGMGEELCKRLIELDLPINVIMACGKNPELYERLSALKTKGNLAFYPYGFTEKALELIAMSDLYLGKSGNGPLEPAFFNVPIVITHSANNIEKLIADHYVSYRKCAVRIFEIDKAIEFIKESLNGSEEYRALKANRVPRECYGGEGIADIIFAKLDERFHLTDKDKAEV